MGQHKEELEWSIGLQIFWGMFLILRLKSTEFDFY